MSNLLLKNLKNGCRRESIMTFNLVAL